MLNAHLLSAQWIEGAIVSKQSEKSAKRLTCKRSKVTDGKEVVNFPYHGELKILELTPIAVTLNPPCPLPNQSCWTPPLSPTQIQGTTRSQVDTKSEELHQICIRNEQVSEMDLDVHCENAPGRVYSPPRWGH